MANLIASIQIILSVILVVGVLLQNKAAGIGALGGGDSVDSGLHTRRGSEKIIFIGTIIVAILFIVVSFVSFLLS